LDLNRPESLGLYATRNFVIKYEDSDKNLVSIAAWHVLPNKLVKRFHKQLQIEGEVLRNLTNEINLNMVPNNESERNYRTVEALIGSNFNIHNDTERQFLYEELLRKSNLPIVLYLHGNTGSRANGHRIELYKTLRKLGYHVIAVDFRGFADSSNLSPTEKGCVADSLAAYIYVKNLTNNPLYLYGHSLGKSHSHSLACPFVA
jgi:abhydrolase domain-containing protein 12